MSVWKRGDTWWTQFYIDGIRYQQSTGTTNRRLAEQIARKLHEDAVARKYQVVAFDPQRDFGDLAAKFIAEGGATRYHLGRLDSLLPFWSAIPVLRLNKGMAQEYRNWRHRQKTISDATINRDLSVLRHILYWATDNSLLVANPLARLRLARERRTKTHILSVSEEALLLPACSEHFRPIVITAVDTGMRRGELLQQSRADVDLERGLLSVTRSKTPEGESREIPLTARVQKLLESRAQGDGLIFTFHDQPIHIIKTAWKGALRRSGIRRLRFHDLRHTFNTRLMEAGVVQDVRKALMGHSSGQDVHAAYTHVELPIKRQAIKRLEEWIAQQKADAKRNEIDVQPNFANGSDSCPAVSEGTDPDRPPVETAG